MPATPDIPTGRTRALFWANPWAFALYGLVLALPLLVWIVRAAVGTIHPVFPMFYAVAAGSFLAYATLASALRVCSNGVIVPEPYRTVSNLWSSPEFVPWNVVERVHNARAGVTLDLVDGSQVVLPGYHRDKLNTSIEAALRDARRGEALVAPKKPA